MLAVPWGKTSSGLHLLYFRSHGAAVGHPYHLYEETQQKAFILHYPLGYLCGGIIALMRGILSIKRKKKLSTSSFSPLHVFHISEKLLSGSEVKENDIYPSRHRDLTANWCGRSLVLIQPDVLVFYIPSVMLGERKTYVAADIISYWSEVGFPQVLYLSGIINLIKCSSFCAQLEQVRYSCPDSTSMKQDAWLHWTSDERHKHNINEWMIINVISCSKVLWFTTVLSATLSTCRVTNITMPTEKPLYFHKIWEQMTVMPMFSEGHAGGRDTFFFTDNTGIDF